MRYFKIMLALIFAIALFSSAASAATFNYWDPNTGSLVNFGSDPNLDVGDPCPSYRQPTVSPNWDCAYGADYVDYDGR